MATPFTPSKLSEVAVPADETLLNAPDRKPLPFPPFIPPGSDYGHSERDGVDGGGTIIDSGHRDHDVDPDVTPKPDFETAKDKSQLLSLDDWLKQGNISSFSADTTLSPAENMANLYNWLNSVFAYYSASNDKSAFNFQNLLMHLYTTISTSNNSFIQDLSDAASLELAEKISDQMFSFITAEFNSANSLYSWYLQQEYNSPVEQVRRLSDAGLNTAFALGNLSSGNAQSAPSAGIIQNPSPSNAGQAEGQAQANKMGLFGTIFGAAASFIPYVGGAVGSIIKDVTSAQVARKMLPSELAKMDSVVALNQANAIRMQGELDAMQGSTALSFLDSEFKFGQQELSNAENQVNQNALNYRTLFQNHTADLQEIAWETVVVDKNGHKKRYRLTNEELKKAAENGGKVGNSYTIVGSEGWSNSMTGKATVELGKKNSKTNGSSNSISNAESSSSALGESSSTLSSSGQSFSSNFMDYLGIGGSTSVEDTYSKNGSSSESTGNTSETVFNDSRTNTTGSVGYNESGTEFHIGDSVFYSVTNRRRVPLPEYEEELKHSLQIWQDSVDRFNALTDAQQRRLLHLEDMCVKNYKTFCSHLTGHTYSDMLRNIFKPKQVDNQLQGD